MRSRTFLTILFTGLVVSAVQGLWLRRRLPRLGAAAGAPRGCVQREYWAVNLLVIGESSVAGVGVAHLSDGLAGQIARQLSVILDCSVHWRSIGKIGATATSLTGLLAEERCSAQPRTDVAVVALGINDVLRLRSPYRWCRDMLALVRQVRRRHECDWVVFAPVPPLWKFKSLPWPLRALLGAEAFALDRVLRWIASQAARVLYVPVPLHDQRELLAADGFHPSIAGYQAWASHMASAIAQVHEVCRA